MKSMMATTKASRSVIVVALPHDVVVDIVGRMAASSPQPIADLCSLRATCKAMYKACKEGAVGRCVTLEREEEMKWLDNGRYVAVVDHLAGTGNPEACFIVSLSLVFAHQDMQHCLVCLEWAAITSHKAVTYVLGLLLYMDDESRGVEKYYISQVEGEPAGGGYETAKRTNRECKWCRRLAADAVQEATWKMDGSLGRVWVLSEDGHRCKGIPPYDYRIRHEYAKFFAQVLDYLP